MHQKKYIFWEASQAVDAARSPSVPQVQDMHHGLLYTAQQTLQMEDSEAMRADALDGQTAECTVRDELLKPFWHLCLQRSVCKVIIWQ